MSLGSRRSRAERPGRPGRKGVRPGPDARDTGVVRARSAIAALLVVDVVALLLTIWIHALPAADLPGAQEGDAAEGAAVLGLAWGGTGAVLAWLRPRNVLGWLFLGTGTLGVLSVLLATYGAYGVALAPASPPLARWSAWLASAMWPPALLPLAGPMLALYPQGRLPSPRWRWPVAGAWAGILLLTVALLLDPEAYDDIAPGPPPLSAPALAPVVAVAGAVTLIPGTLAIWAMSVRRLVRTRSPERQQLSWLFLVIVVFFVLGFALPREMVVVLGGAVPVAVAVGVFRYNLLGIEVVLRRGLVYGALTTTVAAMFLTVTALGGSQLGRGPLPAVVAAGLVAVGLTPLRERLQVSVDRLVYGDRRDPLRAVTRLGHRVAAAGEPELLPAVLDSVIAAVRAPGAAVYGLDGRVRAARGTAVPRPGEAAVTLALRVSGQDVGSLQVMARRRKEPYSGLDRRLLAILAPQVAVVVRALDLAESLEAARDRVLAATREERDRLRRDLHDGLGPSLSGVGLGLQALDDALAAGESATAGRLLDRVREEVGTGIAEVRRILEDLRPAMLDGADLEHALRRHVMTMTADVAVSLDVAELPPLPARVEDAAYRVAREALTNVLRHADARSARVAVMAAGDALALRVSDDGVGMAGAAAEGVGLASMRRRAEMLGGTLTLTSDARGTALLATFPLQQPPA